MIIDQLKLPILSSSITTCNFLAQWTRNNSVAAFLSSGSCSLRRLASVPNVPIVRLVFCHIRYSPCHRCPSPALWKEGVLLRTPRGKSRCGLRDCPELATCLLPWLLLFLWKKERRTGRTPLTRETQVQTRKTLPCFHLHETPVKMNEPWCCGELRSRAW